MTDLNELLERVKGTTGPNRELDLGLFKVANPEYDSDDWQEYAGGVRHRNDGSDMREVPKVSLPYYTSSVDAVLSLVKRILPEGRVALFQRSDRKWFARLDSFEISVSSGEADATTAPIAILAALLYALSYKEPSNDQ